MSRLRLASYRDLKRVAEAAGYVWVRCRGSHNIFRRADGRIVTIPDHGSDVIVRGLLRKIIRDLDLTPDEYHALLDQQ